MPPWILGTLCPTQVSKCALYSLASSTFPAENVAKMIAGADAEVVGAVKAGHAGLMTLISEAARTNATSESVQSTLEEAGLRTSRASALAKGYQERAVDVREQLRSNAVLNAPRVVGIDWRMDYSLESSASGSQHEAVYFITLKVQDVEGDLSSIRDVTFLCGSEQLQDLHAKVEDAVAQVQRVL